MDDNYRVVEVLEGEPKKGMREEWTFKWQPTLSHHPYVRQLSLGTFHHVSISSFTPTPFHVLFLPKPPTLALNGWLLKSNLKRTANLSTIKIIIYPASVIIYYASHPLQWMTSPCTSKVEPYPCDLHPLIYSKTYSSLSQLSSLSFLHHWLLFFYWIMCPF